MGVGIEAMNIYVGRSFLDVRQLFQVRGLDMKRFSNLLMLQKSVNLPWEDTVTNAVNAAKPLLDRLSEDEKNRIELVIVGTESGLDFGKSISTYIQDYLALSRRCRSFEVKHACYGGTAALQMAASFAAASPIPGLKALVIATDATSGPARMTYWEPSQGAGAVAMLVSAQPEVLELDTGASGYYSYEVMDTLRPRPDLESGDSDLSLLSYMHCLERAFELYRERVASADIEKTFDYLVFHTPFAGMVKGAHRMLLRKTKSASPKDIENDFEARVAPSLSYSVRVGNTCSASLYVALCSLIDNASFEMRKRIGLFSYGSGCASEFYSGVISSEAQKKLKQFRLADALAERRALTMKEYEAISDSSADRMCGVRDKKFDVSSHDSIYQECFAGRGLLVLDEIRNFHRKYAWS